MNLMDIEYSKEFLKYCNKKNFSFFFFFFKLKYFENDIMMNNHSLHLYTKEYNTTTF
jgi:hypothetical protein